MSMLRKIVGSLWVAGMLLFAPIALAQDPSVKIYGVYNPNGYHEGEPAKFLLRCSADCRGKTINIKTSEVHSTGGQMLVSPGTTGVALSSATDSAPRFNDGRRHIVSVATQDDGIAGARSLVRAEIVAGTGYTRGAPWRAQRTYRDSSTARGATTSIGTVRIQPYPAEVNMGSEVRFRLTSDRSISQDVPITIHVGADHGGLLDNPPTSITMSAGQRFAVLSVPTNSVTLTQDATINVLVTPTADYAVLAGERQIAEVTVKAPLPVVSFESLTDEVHAGDSIGFIVKRNVLSGEPLDVRLNYNFSGARHFILPGQPSSRTLTIPANELEVYDSVPTQVTDRTERDGTFKVTLLPISRVYGVTTTPTKTVTIRNHREPQYTLRTLSSARIADGGSIRLQIQRLGNSTEATTVGVLIHEDAPLHATPYCVVTGADGVCNTRRRSDSISSRHHRLIGFSTRLVTFAANERAKVVTLETRGDDILPESVICVALEQPDGRDPFKLDQGQRNRSCEEVAIQHTVTENDRPEFAIAGDEITIVTTTHEVQQGRIHEGAEGNFAVFKVIRTPSIVWEERTVRVSFETTGPYWNTNSRPAARDLTFGALGSGSDGFHTVGDSSDDDSDIPSGYSEQHIRIALPDDDRPPTPSRIRARIHTSSGYTVKGSHYTPWVTLVRNMSHDNLTITGPESIQEGRSATYSLSRDDVGVVDYSASIFYIVYSPSHAGTHGYKDVRFPRSARTARFSMASINDSYANGDGEIVVILAKYRNQVLRDQIARIEAQRDAAQARHDASQAGATTPVAWNTTSTYTGYKNRIDALNARLRESTSEQHYDHDLEAHSRGRESYQGWVTTRVIDDEVESRLPTVSISRLTSQINEGQTARFRVSRNGPTTHPLYVNMWVSETGNTYGGFCTNTGTGRNPQGYTFERVTSRTISIPEQPLPSRACLVGVDIPAGRNSADINIPTFPDTRVEDNSIISVELGGGRPEHYQRRLGRPDPLHEDCTPTTCLPPDAEFSEATRLLNTVTTKVIDQNALGLTNRSILRLPAYTGADPVVEGGTLTFQVSKVCCTGRAVTAQLEYTDPSGVLVTPPSVVAIGANEASATVSIGVRQNTVPDDDSSVTVALVDHSSYLLIDADDQGTERSEFTVSIRSDDPYLILSPDTVALSVDEGQQVSMTFSPRGYNFAGRTIKHRTVDGSATAGSDYVAYALDTTTFQSNTSGVGFPFTAKTDSVDDADETFQFEAWSPAGNNQILFREKYEEDGVTKHRFVDRIVITITITNDGALPKAWVAESAHVMGTASVDRIIDRLYSVGGNKDGAWASTSRSGIDGSGVTGSMEHSMVGADYLLADDLRFGIAIAGHTGEGSYEGADGQYDMDADLVGVYPYVQWQQMDTWQFWGIAGRASGDIGIGMEQMQVSTGMTSELFAIGAKGYLLGDRNDALTLTSATDAMWVWAASENARGMHAAKSRSYRYRNILELGYTLELGDASVRPTAAVESEYHGGDIEERKDITGIAGVEWVRDQLGVSFTTTLLDETEQELEIAYEGERWEVAVRADEDRRLAGRVAWNRTNRLTPYASWASGQWEVGQSMALGETSDLSMYVSHDDAARAGVQIRLNW